MDENNFFLIHNQTRKKNPPPKKNPYFTYINLTQLKPNILRYQFIVACIEERMRFYHTSNLTGKFTAAKIHVLQSNVLYLLFRHILS